jgi:hypothetical protein
VWTQRVNHASGELTYVALGEIIPAEPGEERVVQARADEQFDRWTPI